MNKDIIAMQAEMEAVKAEIIGMEAENQYRVQLGESIAYGEGAFQEKANYLFGVAANLRFLDTE